MSEPIRLSPDPSVALVGYRFTAESEGPQAFHDVALMLGEMDPDRCPCTLGGHTEGLRGGYQVVCFACREVLRYWTCDCPDACYRERACRHVRESVRLFALERKGEAAP